METALRCHLSYSSVRILCSWGKGQRERGRERERGEREGEREEKGEKEREERRRMGEHLPAVRRECVRHVHICQPTFIYQTLSSSHTHTHTALPGGHVI